MQRVAPWIVVAGLALVSPTRGDVPPPGDLARLQGAWSLVAMTRNGDDAVLDGLENSTLIFEGNEYRVERRGEVLERGTFRLDPDASPKQVDVTPSQGRDQGKTIRGIYAFEGETLKTCVAPPEADRPGVFEARPGTDHMLFTYKKQPAR